MKAFLFAAVLAAPGVGLDPSLYQFVTPGVTSPDDAKRRLGQPYVDYETDMLDGEMSMMITGPNAEDLSEIYVRAETEKKKVVKVRILEWRDREAYSSSADLVFRDGKLWYALVPPSSSESTPKKVNARYGEPAAKVKQKRRSADIVHDLVIASYPAQGVGFVLKDGEIVHKIVFARSEK